MTELSPEARALFDAARESLGPTATDRDRVWAQLQARIEAGRPAVRSAVANPPSVPPRSSPWLWRVRIVSAVIALAGAGAYVAGHARPRVDALRNTLPLDRFAPFATVHTAASAAIAAIVPAASPPAVEVSPRSVTEPSTAGSPPSRALRAGSMRAAASAPAPEHDTDSLERELVLLRGASAAFNRGEASEAMTLLDEHARDHRHGALAEERDAQRVLVLCALGRAAEARASAEAFLRHAPHSPHAARIANSCAAIEPSITNP